VSVSEFGELCFALKGLHLTALFVCLGEDDPFDLSFDWQFLDDITCAKKTIVNELKRQFATEKIETTVNDVSWSYLFNTTTEKMNFFP